MDLRFQEPPYRLLISLHRLFILSLFLFPLPLAAEQDGELMRRFQEILFYYSGTLGIGYKSLADDPSYFLTDNGRKDPEGELAATKELLLSGEEEEIKSFLCQFPARSELVLHALGKEFSLDHCEEWMSWSNALKSDRVYLVFPASYVNNPASAFGHTLLRIGPEERGEGRLLDYAISYAAQTHGENPVIYVLKGIFGGYEGFFSITPFYTKVRQYSDSENRDLWEYPLELTEREKRRILLLMWEVRNIAFDYYYFDDNCSSFLFQFLDAVREDQMEWPGYLPWVIPTATIREIARDGALKSDGEFFPSALSQLRERIEALKASEQRRLNLLENDSLQPFLAFLRELSAERAAAVADVGLEFLSYQKRREPERAGEIDAMRYELLLYRSRLPLKPFSSLMKGEDPRNSHSENRLGAGFGANRESGFFELSYRAAYHDLLDRPLGYVPGAEIEIAPMRFQVDEEGDLSIRQIDLVNISSLSLRDELVRPISWKLKTGYEELPPFEIGEEKLGYLEVGLGPSFSPHSSVLLWSLFGVRADGGEEGFQGGPLASLGARGDLGDGALWLIEAEASPLFGEGENLHGELSLGLNLPIGRDRALRAKVDNLWRDDHYGYEMSLSFLWYYS